MIILIAPETDIPNEIKILHQLFQSGLEYYHFRKPYKTIDEHRDYLDQINPEYYKRIMIHNHYELTIEYDLKGIHLEEQKWRDQGDGLQVYVDKFTSKKYKVSSSYHEPEDLAAQPVKFDYFMLSPVFSAISKSDMKGRGFDVNHISKIIVGMGGINTDTIPEALKLGFKGAGTLGGIWNTNNPVQSFLGMKSFF